MNKNEKNGQNSSVATSTTIVTYGETMIENGSTKSCNSIYDHQSKELAEKNYNDTKAMWMALDEKGLGAFDEEFSNEWKSISIATRVGDNLYVRTFEVNINNN